MHFVLLWLTLGMAVLIHCGIDETVTYLGLEAATKGDETSESSQVYIGVCLALMVLMWPLVLLEMVRSNQR
ncbi:MAG: hypothetical protein AB1758_06345 [Candidatus Eremiobacterota bacterium]